MAATMVGRICNKWNHLILNLRYLNCGQHQTLVNQVRFLSLDSSHSVQSKNDSSHPSVLLQKPKFPSNVFIMYLNKMVPVIQKDNPDIKRKELISKAAQMWKELDPEEKSKLSIERKELLDKYKKDLKVFLDNLTPEQITELESKNLKNVTKKKKIERKSLGIPKKPVGAFGSFISEKFGERSNEPVAEFFKALTDRWHLMSTTEKEPYMKKAEDRKAAYQQEIQQWEKEMMSLGRFDLVRKGSLLKLTQVKAKKKTKRSKSSTAADVEK